MGNGLGPFCARGRPPPVPESRVRDPLCVMVWTRGGLHKFDTFSFNLYLSTVFLIFKYSTVFISLLGTIYFNLIITFYLRGSKHGAVFMFKLCIYYSLRG